MLRFPSILSRIVVLHVVVVVAASVLLPVALSLLLGRSTADIHNRAMRAQALALAERLRFADDGRLVLDLPPDLQGLYSQPYGRYAYAVTDAEGRVLLSSLADRAALFPGPRRRDDGETLSALHGDGTLAGVSIRHRVGDRTLWIQTGEDLANRDVLIDDIVADFFRTAGWITVPVLLILLLIDIAIFLRALRPLKQASEIAAGIGPDRTDLRLPAHSLPAELQPLVRAVNGALDRLEAGFRAQREFTADAAHELRTPLTILRSRLEALEGGQGRALAADVDRMAHVVGQLLDSAELEAAVIDPAARCDLHAVCMDVIALLAPLAVAANREIALVGHEGPVEVQGDAAMIWRALRNLGENALRHAPPGTTVEFDLSPDGRVAVQDEGPGIPPAERELVFQRFWRSDHSGAGGSGLGLSIVRRIAELNGATVTLGDNRPHGARVVLQFVSAARSAASPPAPADRPASLAENRTAP
jgi:signal transduction histidine kinase